jgi:hypothetical protein
MEVLDKAAQPFEDRDSIARWTDSTARTERGTGLEGIHAG